MSSNIKIQEKAKLPFCWQAEEVEKIRQESKKCQEYYSAESVLAELDAMLKKAKES
jgi:hypothetical protein